MDKKRIEEAKNNIFNYLNDGLIKKCNFDENIYNTYKKNSNESLEVAQNLFENKTSDLWVIVTSYYSMFYIANAYFMKIGFKVGHKIAHKITADTLIVYVKNKIEKIYLEEFEIASNQALSIAENLIESFDFERIKRSRIQYETTTQIKHSKAKTSLERAKLFILEMEKLIDEN